MSTHKRAAVLIGVSKTGNLKQLSAAIDGAKRMGEWARNQGFAKKLVKVITDEKRPVRAQQIKDAVTTLLKEDGIEQMIVYFAGHGVNKGGSEYWLLSGAPIDVDAAVNLDASVDLARFVGIPHVVFISDACRTAAEGIQAQKLRGAAVFPSLPDDNENPVDVFFACKLGSPALEIKDPKYSSGIFKAVYTDAMLDALEGKRTEVIEELLEGDKKIGLVRPHPLGDYLVGELTKRLYGLKTEEGPVIQVPYARLTSREKTTWMARFVERRVERIPGGRPQSIRSEPSIKRPDSIHGVTQSALRAALHGDREAVTKIIDAAIGAQIGGALQLQRTIERIQPAFGPEHFESNCGVKVRGNHVVEAYIRGARATIFADGNAVHVDNLKSPAASALLIFKDGTGMVFPAIPDFIAGLSFDDGELLNISYEPSRLWPDFESRLNDYQVLRSVIAASVRLGAFQLEGEDAAGLAREMQLSKNADPAMALYAAYAYHDIRQGDRLRQMHDFQQQDLRLRLFDVAMLARTLNGRRSDIESDVFPDYPLFAQGWALLSAFGIELPERLSTLRDHLVPSIWSIFDSEGVSILRSAVLSGEIK